MKVLIEVTRKTKYASIVEMSQADYDRLEKSWEAGGQEGRSAEEEMNGLIDTSDWQDDELSDVDDLSIFKEED